MQRAAAIITDQGGRASHATIVSRGLRLPVIVGADNVTYLPYDEQETIVSCVEGRGGFVHEGVAGFMVEKIDSDNIPATRTKVMLNLANPTVALHWWRIPADGVGLTRMELVVSNHIKIHPMALARSDTLKDEDAERTIAALAMGYEDRMEYFVDRLVRGLGRIAAAQYPRLVIVCMSDFRTDEYAHLIGGAEFEPKEDNPVLGFRGTSRYYSPCYRGGFTLEYRVTRHLRNKIGSTNVVVMILFRRSTKEADRMSEVTTDNDIHRSEADLQIYVMCEIPSNVILIRAFAQRFGGFSVDSSDLTQLTLGVDCNSADLAALFDEQDDTVRWMIHSVTTSARGAGVHIGLCDQTPSDHPEFAAFPVECGIDFMSVNPDSFAAIKCSMAATESTAAKAL